MSAGRAARHAHDAHGAIWVHAVSVGNPRRRAAGGRFARALARQTC